MLVVNYTTNIVDEWPNTPEHERWAINGTKGVFLYKGEIEWYNNKRYVKGKAPITPFDQLQRAICDKINIWRDEARQSDTVNYGGNLFTLRDSDQNNINSQCLIANMMINKQMSRAPQELRDYDNISHQMTPEEIIAIGLLIGTAITEIYRKSWKMKDSVMSMEDTIENREILKNLTWDDISIVTP